MSDAENPSVFAAPGSMGAFPSDAILEPMASEDEPDDLDDLDEEMDDDEVGE